MSFLCVHIHPPPCTTVETCLCLDYSGHIRTELLSVLTQKTSYRNGPGFDLLFTRTFTANIHKGVKLTQSPQIRTGLELKDKIHTGRVLFRVK